MPFIDPWLQQGNTSPLETERRMYAKTGNAVHVWRAIRICREPGTVCDGFPDWVCDYLGNIARGVDDMYRDHEDGRLDLRSQAAALMGLTRPAGGARGTAFTDADLAHRNLTLATMVARYLREHPGASPADAFASLAEDQACRAARFEETNAATMLASCVKPTLHETRISEDAFREAWTGWRDFTDGQNDQGESTPTRPVRDKSGVPGQN
jgi:hypothetical protein